MAKNSNSDFIDIRPVLKQYLSKWYLFVISVIFCVGLVWAYTSIKNPKYAVRANVLISQENNNPMAKMGGLGDLFGANGSVDDEIFVLSSHSLYRDVAKDLGINISHKVKTGLLGSRLAYPDFPLQVSAAEGMFDTLRTTLLFKIKVHEDGKTDISTKVKRKVVAELEDVNLPASVETDYGTFTIIPTEYFVPGEELKTTITVSGYNSAAEQLDLDVVNEIATKRSNVINMAIDTPNPVWGEAILNEIIKKYNQRGILEKNAQAENTADFLEKRLEIIASDLTQSEVEIQRYKQLKGIVDLETEAKYQIEKKAGIEGSLLEAETQREIEMMTRDFLSSPENHYSLIPMTVENLGLQKAIEAYNELVLSRIDLENSAKTNNASLKKITEQVDLMRANILTSISKALESSEIQIREMKRQLGSADSRLADIPSQEREFMDMKRQQIVKHQLYMFLLQKREENAVLLANGTPKGIIVDEAFTLSEPLGMSRKMMLALAVIFGLCIPPALLYVRKLLRNRFETRQEVERLTDIPILGEMCIDNSGRSLVVTKEDTSPASELFRMMRSSLLFILNDSHDKVVLMTSGTSGEGKSFISINLASSLALLGKRVLLIGMDIRKPRLAEYLGINPPFGLTQYLSSDKIELSRIINPYHAVDGLDVITGGPVPPNPAELLASPKTDQMFKELREMYDYIVVDTAPVGLVSDTFSLDRVADASIFVCRMNYTPVSEINELNEIYEQRRLKKLSLVINGSASRKKYGYGNEPTS